VTGGKPRNTQIRIGDKEDEITSIVQMQVFFGVLSEIPHSFVDNFRKTRRLSARTSNFRFEFGFARSNASVLNYLNPRKDIIMIKVISQLVSVYGKCEMIKHAIEITDSRGISFCSESTVRLSIVNIIMCPNWKSFGKNPP
jgi:hypothetical protein